MRKSYFILPVFLPLLLLSACQTKSAMKREQDFQTMKKQFTLAKGDSADFKSAIEDMRTEMAQLGGIVEQNAELQRKQLDAFRSEITTLEERVAEMEQSQIDREEAAKARAAAKAAAARKKVSYARGKKLYDGKKYEGAAEVFAAILRNSPDSRHAKNAQFYLAECHYKVKDYATSALEFASFRKQYPKDKRIPTAIYRQARSFKLLGKKKEAKLFFRELTDRFPKSSLAKAAKKEMKSLQ